MGESNSIRQKKSIQRGILMFTSDYWKAFEETGDIMDYLYYRGMETCSHTFLEEEEKISEANSDRYGFINDAYGRV